MREKARIKLSEFQRFGLAIVTTASAAVAFGPAPRKPETQKPDLATIAS